MSKSSLHTSVWSLRFLHHLRPAVLSSAYCVETCTSMYNLYIRAACYYLFKKNKTCKWHVAMLQGCNYNAAIRLVHRVLVNPHGVLGVFYRVPIIFPPWRRNRVLWPYLLDTVFQFLCDLEDLWSPCIETLLCSLCLGFYTEPFGLLNHIIDIHCLGDFYVISLPPRVINACTY